MLRDPDWLTEQVRRLGRPWRSDDLRILATLWWYSASDVLVQRPVSTLVSRGRAADPLPDAVQVRQDGYLAGAWSDRTLPEGSAALGAALAPALGPSIDALAELGGAGRRSLWAITADAVANRMLLAGPSAAPGLAAQVAVASAGLLPRPRYVTAGSGCYVRRASCCLIYLLPQEGKCISCPRQTPEVRAQRLHAHAAGR